MKYIQFDLPDKSTWHVPLSVILENYYSCPDDYHEPTEDINEEDLLEWLSSDSGSSSTVIGPHAMCVHQPIPEVPFTRMSPMHNTMWDSCQHSNLVIVEKD